MILLRRQIPLKKDEEALGETDTQVIEQLVVALAWPLRQRSTCYSSWDTFLRATITGNNTWELELQDW